MIRQLTSAQVRDFIAEKWIAVIHFDAMWNTYRDHVRHRMVAAESEFADHAAFAEVDCDREQELARSIPVLNVPLVAYYKDARLVASLISAHQDIRGRVERLLRGQAIGYHDDLS